MFIKRFHKFHLLLLLILLTISVLFGGTQQAYASAQKKDTYLIKINRSYNTITIYKKDSKGKYTVPIKAMICSVGKSGKTRTGTFKTKAKYRWKLLMNDVWGQYSTRIDGGMLFHSVYYYDDNPASLATKEYNKLGSAASHGCVRLMVKDAKWIYDNCALKTTVVIYDDKKSPGPLGKPEAIKIPSGTRWDPTDPDKRNPFAKKKPVISGVKNQKIEWNQNIDLHKNVKAKSSVGSNITSKIKVSQKVNVSVPGVYKVTYSVVDELSRTVSKTITITVAKNKLAPTYTGVLDKVVGGSTVINNDFALNGVGANCGKYKLAKDLIKITIDKKSATLYYITYRSSVGGGPTGEKKIKIELDNLPPVISGVKDRTLEPGEVPVEAALLKAVTVKDNFSKLNEIKLKVQINKDQDGNYIVIYEATDKFGNSSSVQCILHAATPTPSPEPTKPASSKKASLKLMLFGTFFRQISNNYI